MSIDSTARTNASGWRRGLTVLSPWLLFGCYGGAHDADGEAPPETDASSAGGDDSGGDDSGGDPDSCAATQSVARAPLRRLSRALLANAILDLVGVDADTDSLPPDEKVGPFDANVIAPVSEAAVDEYAAIAADVAAAIDVETLQTIAGGCADATCVPDVVAAFGLRAFRRPLDEVEITAYAELHAVGAADGFDEGTRLVVEAMLQSPWFLYMVETRGSAALDDDATYLLDGYAIATRLSFFLWSSTPSDELLAAAAAGEIDDPDGLAARAAEMFADPRTSAAIGGFHLQWLELDALQEVAKSTEVIDVWDDALIEDMQAETAAFASHVLRDDDGRLATLLTASYSLPSPALYDIYGIDAQSVDDSGVAALPEERAGLLTLPAVLARHSNPDQSSPILRGLLVRENLLCDELPDPPPDVDNSPPVPEPGATTRELFEQHTSVETCASCHVLMDPIGFGFEAFDAIGRFRSEQDGVAIDDLGTLIGTDVDGDFTGVRELAERLAGSEVVQTCVATQWFRYGLGRIESDDDTCSLDAIQQSFRDKGGDVSSLVLDIVASDAFRHGRWTH